MAEVYFILGAEGAGRREVVRDLIDGGFAEDEQIAIALHTSEPTTPVNEELTSRDATQLMTYEDLRQIQTPAAAEAIFIVASGRGNPLDFIEAFAEWLEISGQSLARIITVVHCQLLHAQPKLELWHRACIHFSDVVLLDRREDVPNKWFSDFKKPYEHDHYPCLFELVKKGRVKNPALILEPQPRRLSLAFDDDLDAIDLLEIDEDDLPEETIDLTRPTDPWLVRLPSGQWEKHLPDIAKFLDQD
ncbi:hypothetical protein [Cerasicoccus fimbriatus]|uniref:hypothetical protein n=1 Tax=Cerasicoccus fimbriatus TaxID=3014554 RepID=UPI0022B5A116|nr:hypothetical protein [Cerasicoccus sp. TK19100]